MSKIERTEGSKVAPAKKDIKMKRRKFTKDDLQLTILSFPTVIWYVLFTYLPMFGIILAFKNYRPIRGANFIQSLFASDWVGTQNFEFMFRTPDAALIFRNTILYSLAFIVIGLVINLSLALIISEIYSKRLQKITQTMIFLPFFLSWVVVNYFVYAFLSPTQGLLNSILASQGEPMKMWYFEEKYWPYIIIFLNQWKGMGYGMVLYMAGIAGIDQEMYEAAVIDGASKWQQVRYISLPSLKTLILILFILNVGSMLNSDIGLFYIVPRNSGPLVNVTQTLDVYVYKGLMGMNNLGFSSAAAMLKSVFGLILILVTNGIVRKVDAESALF